jgi:hypothetical protein
VKGNNIIITTNTAYQRPRDMTTIQETRSWTTNTSLRMSKEDRIQRKEAKDTINMEAKEGRK